MKKVSCETTDEMRAYALFGGGDFMDMAVFDPFDAQVGTKIFNPYYAYLITHPSGNVLFDAAAHPDLGTDPKSRMGDAAESFAVRMGPQDWVIPRLKELGLEPGDISTVVQSHLHFDHTGALAWFPHARILVQRKELAFAMNPPVYQAGAYLKADFDIGLNWDLLDGERDVFGDGKIRCIPTPGHTPGHQSLLVDLPSRPLFLLADTHYLLSKMRQRAMPGFLWSPDALVDTWDRVEEIERKTNARLVLTHELDFETSVPKSPQEFYS